MKVAKKVLGTVLAVLAVFFMVGCDQPTQTADPAVTSGPEENGGESTEDAYVPLTTEFATYYLNIAEADLGGLEGFHLKNTSSAPIGIEIQKIFASTTKSQDGAVLIYDFTLGADAEVCKGTAYWGFGAGTCDGTKWSSGEVAGVGDGETEVYITGFASAGFVDASYVGIVAKNLSETVKGDDLYLVPIIGEPDTEKAATFKDLFNK